MPTLLRKIPFSVQILLGLVFGLGLGYLARVADLSWLGTTLDTIGSLFVQLLRVAVPPLVFTAIVVSVVSLRGVANAARLALKTLLWFGITALASVAVGIGLGLLTNPGRGVTLDLSAAKEPQRTGSWTDFLTGLVPTNVFGAFVENNVLQIVFLAVVAGIAALLVGAAAEPFVEFNRSVLAIVQKALWWLIRLAPLGTLGLIGHAVEAYGWDLLAPLATFTTAVYVGCAIVLLVVYPLVLVLAGRLNPLRFYAGAWPAIELAFVSRSSVGTMPVTQRVVERLGVPREYASFAVPFGATTKMDGCAAVYPALAAIFVAQVFGVNLSPLDYLLIAFVSVVGSAATAGLTGALVMLTLTLSTLGLPLAGAGLLLAIDPILDMMRTATNVAGQALVPTVVAAREGVLDRATYDSAGRRDLTEEVPAESPAPVAA
ncbi:dicarboxylate/amino acid:cation symporter [Micromonospora sp. HM5-17]|jgi:Na+/H+-dicarboxylate symporter|uniref:dicarboxylate/amino acid:cation symporter n=1 Tax=Micromonospora sp. HM5-17 TaxID=2487710 RepID=UPI000F46C989|nr:dicarboxylate/amino acid:cation symporter [Micromonospora sp. HM5-17]ROT32780.1 dicarboxylate/amino acid:cation symporter [Micromonospora sp. HM5-17]